MKPISQHWNALWQALLKPLKAILSRLWKWNWRRGAPAYLDAECRTREKQRDHLLRFMFRQVRGSRTARADLDLHDMATRCKWDEHDLQEALGDLAHDGLITIVESETITTTECRLTMAGASRARELIQGRSEWRIAVVLLLLISLFWALFGIWFPRFWVGDSPGNQGLFGDSFGSANALFSAFAFGGVIYAIWLQRKELQLQRQELAMTREEMRRSAKAQEGTERALAIAALTSLMEARIKKYAIGSEYEEVQHMIGELRAFIGMGVEPEQDPEMLSV